MATSFIDDLMEDLIKDDKEGAIMTVQELREHQYGIPLRYYAQRYLFGATGLRLKVFHSISGMPQSCKSPLLFDLMGHVCADSEHHGMGGIGFIYELEDKISPTLLSSVMGQYGDIIGKSFRVVKDMTIEGAFAHLCKKLIPMYNKHVKDFDIPMIVGLDSIGGAASKDTVTKLKEEGAAGKGFYDKAHYMKYFCENAGQVIGDIPMVVVCINQEKEAASSTPGSYGPPQKKITGGASQVFKDGHMISASFRTLASGDGKIITLRTTKTSFSDARKLEVEFRWNKFGTSLDDAYGHHFEWALASAKCLAAPDKGVGDIRDIANVSVSEKNLVTCPQLDCKSVPPEEFEAALNAPEYEKVLNELYMYQKIERIKDLAAYKEYMKERKERQKSKKEKEEEAKASKVKVTKVKAAKAPAAPKAPKARAAKAAPVIYSQPLLGGTKNAGSESAAGIPGSSTDSGEAPEA